MDDGAIRQKLQQVLDLVMKDIASVRSGRAVPAMLEDLSVVVYGGQSKLRIQEIASVTSPDPQSLMISPYDKSIIGDIRKGIEAANLGFNPSIDGEVIRIAVPPLTTEDRERFVKLLSGKVENGKIMIRQIRGDIMKDIKTAFEAKELTEDEKFGQEKKLQAVVDEFVGKIDELGEKKKNDLLQM